LYIVHIDLSSHFFAFDSILVYNTRMHTLFLLCLSIFVIVAREQEGPAVAVACQNAYALCAFANCTVNADLKTASCGCYSFYDPDSISIARVAIIPDDDIRDETRKVCNTSTSCKAPDDVDVAPVCTSIAADAENDGQLWPMADLVSTYAPVLETENGVEKDDQGAAVPTWSCPAAPGRFVPVCMLAPCVFSEPAQNPYNFGTHNMTCTCPLVEADIAYDVFGGLQDPCSQKAIEAGDHVQAAAGALLAKYENDTDYVANAWAEVQVAFESSISNGGGSDSPGGTTSGARYASFKGAPAYTGAFLVASLVSMSLSGM
jgi:hypothetical protein